MTILIIGTVILVIARKFHFVNHLSLFLQTRMYVT